MSNEDEYKKKLSPEAYKVTRQCGTEPPFSGKFNDHKQVGQYTCICCGDVLFESEHKFDSGSGWPSFYQIAKNDNVSEKKDVSHGMVRVEVTCKSCDSHLGHVFNDGPKPTGLRYCINSLSLDFKED